MDKLHLAAEGDTADGLTVVIAVVNARGVDSVRTEAQAVGVGATTDRRPVVAFATCAVQVVVWEGAAAPNKHQRRLHNSIRIS